jgi:predicted amidohydrolase YtcJ
VTVADKADLVLHGGAVLGHPASDSVAIRDGRIIAHGGFDDLKALVGPRTHLLRLNGRTVAPGLIDSHLHFLEAAAAASGLSVWRCRTIADLMAALRLGAGKTPPGNWLRVFGCDEALLAEKRGPTRAELDQAVNKNPLRLRHSTLHASWLNSRAIAALGLEDPGFCPPPGGLIVKDATARATGLVAGMEQWITRKLPLVTAAEIEARARILSRELAAAGVTAFTDATARNDAAQAELFGRLAAGGAICQRMSLMIGADHLDSAPRATAAARAGGFTVAGVKFIPRPGGDVRALANDVRAALARGLDCAFHATEIEELDAALRAAELALDGLGPKSRRAAVLRIEHGGLIPPDALGRIRALGAWVVANPGFIYYRGAKYAADPGLLPYLHRLRSLRDAGVALAGATDAPVTPPRPLVAIAAAVSRLAFEGTEIEPGEKLDPGDAFALFTSAAARLARLEAGAIEAGMLADLIVLPADPLGATAADLMNMAVDVTLVGGHIVYERGRPAVAHSASSDLLSTT